MEETIVNRVAGSGLITLNLEDHYPKTEILELDLAPLLVEGTLLREKDLREFVKTHDFAVYRDKWVAVHCSADAVVPTWAFMLLAVALQPHATRIVYGNRHVALEVAFRESLASVDWNQYRDAKVVVKGCSDVHVPESVFVDATARLREVAASIMYGEPCSTVPLFKRGKSSS